MATIQAVELPTEAEYAKVQEALQAAHDAVEELAWRLDPLRAGRVALVPSEENPNRLVPTAIEPVYPSRPATLEDVGALYSIKAALDVRIGELRDLSENLAEALPYLDGARRDGYVSEAVR